MTSNYLNNRMIKPASVVGSPNPPYKKDHPAYNQLWQQRVTEENIKEFFAEVVKKQINGTNEVLIYARMWYSFLATNLGASYAFEPEIKKTNIAWEWLKNAKFALNNGNIQITLTADAIFDVLYHVELIDFFTDITILSKEFESGTISYRKIQDFQNKYYKYDNSVDKYVPKDSRIYGARATSAILFTEVSHSFTEQFFPMLGNNYYHLLGVC